MDDKEKKTEPSDRKRGLLRCVFGGCAVFALYRILPGIWVNLMYLLFRTKANISHSKAVSVGVIGGADGPTAVFVTSGTNWVNIYGLLGVIVVTILVVFVIYRNKKKK